MWGFFFSKSENLIPICKTPQIFKIIEEQKTIIIIIIINIYIYISSKFSEMSQSLTKVLSRAHAKVSDAKILYLSASNTILTGLQTILISV